MTMGGMRFMPWTHLLIVVAVAGCGPRPLSLDEIGEGYVRAALGLAQHDPALVDDWRGPQAWRPGPRSPVAGLRDTIAGLRRELERTSPTPRDRARRDYLGAQLRALHFAARRLLGDAASIDEQAREEFGVAYGTTDAATIAAIHGSLAVALPGTGSIAERFAALKRRTLVPDAQRLSVMKAALVACRQATVSAAAFLPSEGAPAERVTVTITPGLGWDGSARYLGSGHTTIEINGDGPLDLSRALRLACHEGYPGHHVQYLLIERIGWPELGLSPGFGPHLLYTEGAAEAGAELAFSREDREQIYRDLLAPAAELPPTDAHTLAIVDDLLIGLQPVVTDVARAYLAGSLPRVHAGERLRSEALVLNADAMLTMIERRRARALVYAEGRRLILRQMEQPQLPALGTLFSHALALQ